MAYVDLATLKEALKTTDTTRDNLLTSALDGAAWRIDEKTRGNKEGGAFTLDTSATAREYRVRGRVVPDRDGEILLVDDIGTSAGITIEVGGDGAPFVALDPSRYDVYPDNALARKRPIEGIRLLSGSWRWYRKVRATTQWGWPEVPADIPEANLLQALRWARRPSSPEGVAGSAEWGLIRIPNLDPDVRATLIDYTKPGFA